LAPWTQLSEKLKEICQFAIFPRSCYCCCTHVCSCRPSFIFRSLNMKCDYQTYFLRNRNWEQFK
jgi:hypothetical protein